MDINQRDPVALNSANNTLGRSTWLSKMAARALRNIHCCVRSSRALDHAWLAALLLYMLTTCGVSGNEVFGYCQVYSYNIKYRQSGLQEKHLFACCNNGDEPQCQGATYQKASRTEGFCAGAAITGVGGSHWTEQETVPFPDRGHFYCGGCCGQHLAWQACTDRLTHARIAPDTCLNWVQCFRAECLKVIREVYEHHPIKCTLPPAPLPKHYIYEPKKLPPNVTASFLHPASAEGPANASVSTPGAAGGGAVRGPASFPCTREACLATEMNQRCAIRCCEEYCCLPDGPLPYPHDGSLLGLTTLQVVGIAVGSIALLGAFLGVIVLVLRRLLPGCRNFQFPASQDTQVLVIEGPDDGDSDDDDDHHRDDHEIEIESA